MKKYVMLALLVMSLPGMATVRIEEEVFILGQGPEAVKELLQTGSVEIDHVSRRGFELYGSRGLKSYLDQKNILYIDLKASQKSLTEMAADYPSYTQITSKLQSMAQKYSKIMKLVSVGKSSKGRDLWVMKISDNVNDDEVEPEFKYISSMHGDEITGREMMMRLIDEIGEKYDRDQEITELVNNTEIFIMPSMNPDGSELRQRGNGRGVDLNRNFPDISRDRESTGLNRELEVQAIMAFQASRKFSLSANFHGGAIVANYPWDSIYDRHPLDGFVKELSTGYADLNPEMRTSDEFPGGITNGADWYIVRGGMQDWSYFWHQDLQITIELSQRKWPNYTEIPGFYTSNRDSLVYYMNQVHHGAGVKFNRSAVAGVVSITDLKNNKDMGKYTFSGSEFYKVLPEGNYRFDIRESAGVLRSVDVAVSHNQIKKNGNYVVIP